MKKNEFQIHSRWRAMLKKLELDATYILNTAGLPLDTLSRQGASLNSSDFFKLWQAVEASARDIELGLYLGSIVTSDSFSPAVLACLSSANLENAIMRLTHYEDLINPIKLDIQTSKERITSKLTCTDYTGEIPFSFILYKFAIVTHIARIATKSTISPTQISINTKSKIPDAYREFFSAPLINSGDNSISYSTIDSLIPFQTEDSVMWNYLLNGINNSSLPQPETGDISERVKKALLEILPSGLCSLDEVSSKLTLSKRTLQRQLRAANTNFQNILDQTRLDLATHYLNNTDISVKEVAYLLGYLDTNAFQRAFKKWTGMTPHSFKANQ